MADAIEIVLGKRSSAETKHMMLVSEEDRDMDQITWNCNGNGYAKTDVGGRKSRKKVYAHRLVMERTIGRSLASGEIVDHINHNRLDNQRCNLRIVTDKQNVQNRGVLNRNNRSGFRGVYWHSSASKWSAEVMVDRKKVYLGLFVDLGNANNAAIAKRKALGFLGS